jgi:protein required for attachment to host cells
MRAIREWYLVLDATTARIVRGLAKTAEAGHPEIVIRSPAHKLREIMADKPGRSFASAGGGRRSSYEYPSDPVKEERRAFVRSALALLEQHRRDGEFDALIVVAAPRMLGLLRDEMSAQLRQLVQREIDKDFAGLDLPDLLTALARVRPGP